MYFYRETSLYAALVLSILRLLFNNLIQLVAYERYFGYAFHARNQYSQDIVITIAFAENRVDGRRRAFDTRNRRWM